MLNDLCQWMGERAARINTIHSWHRVCSHHHLNWQVWMGPNVKIMSFCSSQRRFRVSVFINQSDSITETLITSSMKAWCGSACCQPEKQPCTLNGVWQQSEPVSLCWSRAGETNGRHPVVHHSLWKRLWWVITSPALASRRPASHSVSSLVSTDECWLLRHRTCYWHLS